MPRKFLKRFLPDPEWLKNHKHIAMLGSWLHDPNIWHLNRNSVARAFSVGIFFAFVPVPFQMLLAAMCAVLFRANLPLAVALVWITNPLTMPPIFYSAYKLGTFIMQTPIRTHHFELSTAFFSNELSMIWRPFLLGCFVLGTTFSIISNLVIRLLWRIAVVKRWNRRRINRNGNGGGSGGGGSNSGNAG